MICKEKSFIKGGNFIQTNIPRLDSYLDGGIPAGKSLLYYIQPGVEGDVFGMQTLYHNLVKGNAGVLIVFNYSPRVVRENFKEFGWDLDLFNDRFAIIDAYSMLVGETSNEKYVVEDPENLEHIDQLLKKATGELKGDGLVSFCSISTIMDFCGEEKTLEYVQKWNEHIRIKGGVPIYTFTAWPYSERTLRIVKDEMFDAVVRVGGIAERVIFGQYYGLARVNWTKHKKQVMLFKVLKPGGVRVYIPKILITGPYNAGKSSFIHALSDRAISVDRFGTTVALDHGHVDYNGYSIDIFGTPGQERFDPMLKTLGGEAMGVMLVIDSSNTQEFPRAKEMLARSKTHGLPQVVVANKQDIDGALPVEEIREKMKLPEDIPIIPTVAPKRKGVIEALEILIEKITEVA